MTLEMIGICIVDIDAHLPVAQVMSGAAALQRQVSEHFAPIWGGSCAIRVATAELPPTPSEWILELADLPPPDVQGALGIHSRDGNGNPILHVYVGLCLKDGTSWTSCASHELLEAICDPDCIWTADTEDGMFALECADPCETVTYQIDGVEVSDFVTPAWFAGGRGPYDYCRQIDTPRKVLPGGYAQVKTAKGWQQIGARREMRRILSDLGLARARR